MNTQKTQTSSNVKGFTLVELIVVITILVILGTIAFLNLGGMSSSARDSKRTSDIRNLVSQVNIKQTSGVTFMDMISSGSTNQIQGTFLSLAGTGLTTTDYGSVYTAGVPNYVILGLSSDAFKDPLTKGDYVMGATTKGGGGYQTATTMENGDASKTAYVMGIFRARTSTDTASGSSSYINNVNTLTLAAGKGLFKVNDIIGNGTYTGTVTAVASDLSTLTVNSGATATSGIWKLAKDETLGLIRAQFKADGTAASYSGVVNGSGNTLPY